MVEYRTVYVRPSPVFLLPTPYPYLSASATNGEMHNFVDDMISALESCNRDKVSIQLEITL